jgi:hypothetical protein
LFPKNLPLNLMKFYWPIQKDEEKKHKRLKLEEGIILNSQNKSFKLGGQKTSSFIDLQKLKELPENTGEEETENGEIQKSYLSQTLGAKREFFSNSKISQQIEYLEGKQENFIFFRICSKKIH